MLVTFCGHKDVAKEAQVKEKLEAVVASLIEEGATEFYLGGYGSFDSMAAKTIREMKKTHPDVQGILVIPYMDRDYNKDLYDGSVYLCGSGELLCSGLCFFRFDRKLGFRIPGNRSVLVVRVYLSPQYVDCR